MDYVSLLELGIGFLQQILPSLTKAKAPQEILDSISNVISKLQIHKADIINKINLEAQRG